MHTCANKKGLTLNVPSTNRVLERCKIFNAYSIPNIIILLISLPLSANKNCF
jgi:hypothetical protein